MPSVAAAFQLLNETFARLKHATSVVSNFRTTLIAVSSDADKHLNSKLTGLIQDLFEAPEWEGLLAPIDPTAPQSPKKPDYTELAKAGAKAMRGTTYALVDAATLIVYHAILDGVAFDCLRVTALQAPGDWEEDLANAKLARIHRVPLPFKKPYLLPRCRRLILRYLQRCICLSKNTRLSKEGSSHPSGKALLLRPGETVNERTCSASFSESPSAL